MVSRKTNSIAALIAIAVAIIFPSTGTSVFSGIPLSALEVTGLTTILLVLCSKKLRRDWGKALSRLPIRSGVGVIVLTGVVLLLKVLLFVLAPANGFVACYKSLETHTFDPSSGGCESSFDDPFRRSGATRVDAELNFDSIQSRIDQTSWNLGFLNSLSHNFHLPEEPFRQRLPFEVTWTADLTRLNEKALRVLYVGEGQVQIGERTIDLSPSYERPSEVQVETSSSDDKLRIQYRFARVTERSEYDPDAPYAAFSLLDENRFPGRLSIPLWVAALAATVAIALGLLILSCVWTIGQSLRSLRGTWGVLAAIFLGILGPVVLPTSAWSLAVAGTIVFVVLMHQTEGVTRGPALAIATTGFFLIALSDALVDFPTLNHVIYRGGGQDFLTYESQARSILDSWSLQGGEDVFIYSPGFRYFHFVSHLLLGEGEVMPALLTMSILCSATFATTWCARARIVGNGTRRRSRVKKKGSARPRSRVNRAEFLQRIMSNPDFLRGAILAIGAILVMVILSPVVVQLIRDLASEQATWVCIALSLVLFFYCDGMPSWFIAAILVGLAVVVRAEQAIGIFLLLVAFVVGPLREKSGEMWRPRAAVLVVVVLAIAVLPALHNVYYGGELAFVPQTPKLPVNFPLPPGDLSRVAADEEVRKTLIQQIRGLTFSTASDNYPSIPSPRALVHILQLGWIGLVALVMLRLVRLDWPGRWLLMVPIALLVPHIFIQVFVYYPRHVVAGYLAMGLTAIVVMGRVSPTNGVERR